jgi:hypothetical protein
MLCTFVVVGGGGYLGYLIGQSRVGLLLDGCVMLTLTLAFERRTQLREMRKNDDGRNSRRTTATIAPGPRENLRHHTTVALGGFDASRGGRIAVMVLVPAGILLDTSGDLTGALN